MPRRQELRAQSKTTRSLFQYMDSRRWKEAEAVVKRMQTYERTGGGQQMRGYVDALRGILMGLREKYSSPELFIQNIRSRSKKRLKEFQKNFYNQSRGTLYTDYDRGFFKAWYEYIKFLRATKPHHTAVNSASLGKSSTS